VRLRQQLDRRAAKKPALCGLFCILHLHRNPAALLVDANHVVQVKLVRHRAIADAGDHGGHSCALLNEVFLADRVEEALTDNDFTEFDAQAVGVLSHYGRWDKFDEFFGYQGR
jgi:hypothetical protein